MSSYMKGLWKTLKKQELQSSQSTQKAIEKNKFEGQSVQENQQNIYKRARYPPKKYKSFENTKQTYLEETRKRFMESDKVIESPRVDKSSREIQTYRIKNSLETMRIKMDQFEVLKQSILLYMQVQKQNWIEQIYKKEGELKKMLQKKFTEENIKEIEEKDEKIEELQNKVMKMTISQNQKQIEIRQLHKNILQITSLLNEEQEKIKNVFKENIHLKEFISEYEQQINLVQKEVKQNNSYLERKYHQQAKRFYISEIEKLEEELGIISNKYAESQAEMQKREEYLDHREREVELNLMKMHENIEQLYEEYQRVRAKENDILEKERILNQEKEEFNGYRTLFSLQSYQNLKSSQPNMRGRTFYNDHYLNNSKKQSLLIGKSNVSNEFKRAGRRDPKPEKKRQSYMMFNKTKKRDNIKKQSFNKEKYIVSPEYDGQRRSRSNVRQRLMSPIVRSNEQKMKKVGVILEKLKIDIRRQINEAK